jgi:cold shock CspA family protein
METRKGMVIRIATKKGFGFIRQGDGTDIFFHAVGCVEPHFNDLREGMEVEYIVVTDKITKRARAIGVVTV